MTDEQKLIKVLQLYFPRGGSAREVIEFYCGVYALPARNSDGTQSMHVQRLRWVATSLRSKGIIEPHQGRNRRRNSLWKLV